MKYCANHVYCSSYTDSPRPDGWVLTTEIGLFSDHEKSFCCWKCLYQYASMQEVVL